MSTGTWTRRDKVLFVLSLLWFATSLTVMFIAEVHNNTDNEFNNPLWLLGWCGMCAWLWGAPSTWLERKRRE